MTVVIDRLDQPAAHGTVGEIPPPIYVAQTFKAGGAVMRSLDFMIDGVSGPDAVDYRLLITTVYTDANGFHPGTVLKEVAFSEPTDADHTLHRVHVDLGALGLVAGQTYAIVLDGFTDRDGDAGIARVGTSGAGPDTSYADGDMFAFLASSGDTRADHFAATWAQFVLNIDMGFKAVFSNPGVTILGKGLGDRIDATHAPKHQPKPAADDDTISGRGGNDKIDGLAGFDTIDGGAGKDRLFGGDDDDLLIGGNGKDKSTGGLGADTFLFNARLTEPADRIKDFMPVDDVIQLSQKVFKVLPPGVLAITSFANEQAADADDHIIYRSNGQLLYDEDGTGGTKAIVFAKLTTAPADLSHLDFLVV